MAQNKIKIYIDQLMHGSHVNKHRQLMLQLNYRLGLAEENLTRDQLVLEERNAAIELYYQEEIALYKKRLECTTKNDDTRAKKLSTYQEKLYWQKRRYQTTLKRKQQASEIPSLMSAYTKAEKAKLDAYTKELNQKYPHQDLSVEDTKKYEALCEKRKDIRDQRLLKAKENAKRQHRRYEKFVENNRLFIKKNTLKAEALAQKIENYNLEKLSHDRLRVEDIQSKLSLIHSHPKMSLNRKTKKIDHLTEQLDLILKVLESIEDPSIQLNVSNLKMYFGGVKAVNELSFQVKKGEIFGLIGPNGAGKTTVFNCLTQFYKATSGHMVFRNKEDKIVDLYQKKTHDMISEGIARSFQNVELIWELTVIDNLLVAAHSLLVTNYAQHMVHAKKMTREETILRTKGMNVLKNLGIEAYAYRSPYGLPYGILKKVELARTLMTDPTLIILDEPAAGLNDLETKDLAKVIKEINKNFGITIFLVEHDMGLVMSICDRVCAISFGKMIGLGSPKEIQQNPEVRKAYLGDDDDA